jgi:proline iminopeptidase
MKSKRNIVGHLLWFGAVLCVATLTLFGFAYLLTMGDYRVARTVADDPTLPAIVAKGYRFHGETFGDATAPPLIVVHGGPGWDYRSLLPIAALADDYHVIFYDQRGSGLSPRVASEELSLESSLSDLDAIVEEYRAGHQVILVGHSWGAMLVAAYIGREPQKVSQAVLAEPGFLNAELFESSGIRMGPRWEVGYLFFAAERWFESLHITGPDADAPMDYFLGEAASNANPGYYCNGQIPQEGTLRWRAGATAMGAILGSAMDDGGGMRFDITHGLDKFSQPVLLLASECNSLIGIDQQKRHAKYFSSVEVAIIPKSGHMLFAEQPQAALSAVRRFLQSNIVRKSDGF